MNQWMDESMDESINQTNEKNMFIWVRCMHARFEECTVQYSNQQREEDM
jgi:hypothetical protein